jgi:hypothetical protein
VQAWHELVGDAKFLAALTAADERIASEARLGRCPLCGGRLDRGDYPRKPRPGLGAAESSWSKRISLCCSVEGCRHRLTPPSVRFLGRKVYAAPYVVIALVSASAAATAAAIASARTRRRWSEWWQTAFLASACWSELRGRLVPAVAERGLPGSLLARFEGTASEALVSMLTAISAVTTPRGLLSVCAM